MSGKSKFEESYEEAKKEVDGEQVAAVSGGIAGAVWFLTSHAKDYIVTNPFATIAGCGFYSAVWGIGSIAVSLYLVPKPLKVLVPMLLGISSYHYLMKWG